MSLISNLLSFNCFSRLKRCLTSSILLGGSLLLVSPGTTQANGLIVSPQSLIKGSPVDEGRLLLGELNCTSCHAAPDKVTKHLTRKEAPNLSQAGSRMTPQYIRSFLAGPSHEKPGTSMPDLLGHLSENDRNVAVDELVHFLVSLKSDDKPPASDGSNPFWMLEGRRLFHTVGCVACHAPQEPLATMEPAKGESAPDQNALSALNQEHPSVPLSNLAKKHTVHQLTEFLLNPLKVRPSGRMPSLNLTRGEASALAMYLLRGQTNNPSNPPRTKVQGVMVDYFEASLKTTLEIAGLKPKSSGTASSFVLTSKKRDNNIAFRFTGLVTVPRDGEYTFYTHSDDGSRVTIGDRDVAVHDGHHGGSERSGKIQLKAGDHPIKVLWFNAGGPGELRISYSGPGLKKQVIPSSALSFMGEPMVPLDNEILVVDAAKAARGLKRFSSMGCISCHAADMGPNLASSPKPPKAPPLQKANPNAQGGCLSQANSRKAGVPRFDLSPSQRRTLVKVLSENKTLEQPLTVAQQANQSLAAMNCLACHSRDKLGGPADWRAHYFLAIGETDLGDEGRIPPHLSGVGNKLKPEWLRQVLIRKGSVRPYMATRMPQFGEDNVGHLVDILAKADARKPEYPAENLKDSDVKYGRAMVGTKGFSCIACHTWGSYKSLGIQAMDLTQMGKRLQTDWLHRYLLDPASLRPGTRMPSFWPDGQSLNPTLLDGDTHRQINAIIAYLAKGSTAGIPPGLIQGKQEITTTDYARIYRHFITKTGTRGIGVGYPEKANLAFDANELRPTLIWHGPFIDAAKHRSGRGAGQEGPLGYNLLELPGGPPLAVLDKPDQPWPKITGADGGYRMKGYHLDDKRRPTFHYTFDKWRVQDKPEAISGELDASLRRTLTLESDARVGTLWFRAWVGSSVKDRGQGQYVIDERIELKLSSSGGQIPKLRQSEGKTEILVPIVLQDGKATVIEEITW